MTRTAVVVGIILGGIISFLGFQQIIGDGGYPLTVTVRITDPRPVKKVSCCTFGRAEYAAAWCDDEGSLEGYRGPRLDTDFPFTGRRLLVDVPVSTHTTFFGFSERYYQFGFLAIIVEYQDGTRATKTVQIPDGRKTSSVFTTVP